MEPTILDYTVPSKEDALRIFAIRDRLANHLNGVRRDRDEAAEQLIRRGFVDLAAVDAATRDAEANDDSVEEEAWDD